MSSVQQGLWYFVASRGRGVAPRGALVTSSASRASNRTTAAPSAATCSAALRAPPATLWETWGKQRASGFPELFPGVSAESIAVPVEKPAISGMLLEGSRALGLPLTQAQADALSWLAGELGRWSSRINLTAILDPIEMADKHILDSLTVLRALDLGTADPARRRDRSRLPGAAPRHRPGGPLGHPGRLGGQEGRLPQARHRPARARPPGPGHPPEARGTSGGRGPPEPSMPPSPGRWPSPSRWAALAAPLSSAPGGTLVVMAGNARRPARHASRAGKSAPRASTASRLPLTGDWPHDSSPYRTDRGRNVIAAALSSPTTAPDDPCPGPRTRPP